MRQLVKEGWIHHIGRYLVASFFSQNYLFQFWQKGRDIFQKYLTDADWNINTGNWICIATFKSVKKDRPKLCPINSLKVYENSEFFIKKYIPELKNVPKKFIYSPWKMTKNEQIQFDCILGKNYPFPIIPPK